jgi:hypothetical protein
MIGRLQSGVCVCRVTLALPIRMTTKGTWMIVQLDNVFICVTMWSFFRSNQFVALKYDLGLHASPALLLLCINQAML